MRWSYLQALDYFLLSLLVAFVLNFVKLVNVYNGKEFIAYLVSTLVITVIIMAVLRTLAWIFAKIKR